MKKNREKKMSFLKKSLEGDGDAAISQEEQWKECSQAILSMIVGDRKEE